MRKYKADIVLTHFKNSLHKDHARCSKIVSEAQLFAGIDMGDKVEGKAIYVPIYYCENWEDKIGFDRYIMVDVTLGYKLWSEAIQKHWFVMNSKDFKYTLSTTSRGYVCDESLFVKKEYRRFYY